MLKEATADFDREELRRRHRQSGVPSGSQIQVFVLRPEPDGMLLPGDHERRLERNCR